MKYNRNWAWECSADVELEKETVHGWIRTNNKGQISELAMDNCIYDFEDADDRDALKEMGVVAIHFTTPAKLTF